MRRVLLVEDDRSVRESATLVLEAAGFDVVSVPDGEGVVDLASARSFDVVLLDIMLPGRSGLEICQSLRAESQIPIILLTARADARDVVTGLEHGADDYVTKPFDPSVLVARIRSVLRRASPDEPLSARGVSVDERAFRAEREGVELGLSRTELRLLTELLQHAGEVRSREVLLDRVWGYDYLGDSRLVDMAVKRLRDKLGDPTDGPPFIATVRGVGYRFERA
ncbi:MAG TPA: response regulator transcription factor [Acidimicrobiales bacterium]|nr:response regulator transcription factor [Acidimicrobiales bacterium]